MVCFGVSQSAIREIAGLGRVCESEVIGGMADRYFNAPRLASKGLERPEKLRIFHGLGGIWAGKQARGTGFD